tara:strand:+ start:240 stop:1271 length:1032 start_codon:yes stop_codon:yes gene_type:complete
MAISVDTVYKTVLLILNKEQRGYMTPDEFNKIGSQVQREIFEAYFEDLNQQLRIPQSDMEYSNRVAITDEKIAEFKTENDQTVAEKTIGGTNPFTTPSELYRLGSITYEPNASTYKEIQRVGRAEIYNIRKAPLTAPTKNFPIYLYEDNKALVYPETIVNPDHIKMQYVKKPTDIRWGYYPGSLGQLIHDTTTFGANLLNNGGTLSSITNNPTGITTDQTYVNLTTTVSPAGGTGAIVSAVVSGGTVTSVLVTTPGSGYSVNDVLTVSQAQLPGGSSDLDITLTAADFNSGSTFGTTNFELHNSERTEVVLKMLLYQGVVIRDPQIVQVAASRVQQEEVNEKS